VARNEGAFSARFAYPQIMNGLNLKIFTHLVKQIVSQISQPLDVNEMIKFYLQNADKNNSDSLLKSFMDFYGDLYSICPTYEFTKKYSEYNPKNNVYFYEFTYQSTGRFLSCLSNYGICHGSDVEFVFGVPLLTNNTNTLQIDIDFSREVMKFWTNFAKTGYK